MSASCDKQNRKEEPVMEILKTVFGYDDFRPLQKEIIDHILEKKDTLVVLPTGGGKSLCFQLPALMFDGITIVVSPLISLMKDQVDQLQQMGVSAVCLNSSLPAEQYRHHVSLIRNNRVKLLYIAPESLVRPSILEMLQAVTVDCLAIDEAHCISAWGHDFRPEYRHLAQIRQQFPQAACAAFTATATPTVQKDIQTSLGFSQDTGFRPFIGSFDRKNLLIRVVFKDNPLQQALDFLGYHTDDSGIIYCLSRKQVENLSRQLAARGFSVRPYHAGLDDSERNRFQTEFIKDDVRIMVATIAFGMGIDKPNVRFVLHYDLPKSVESYYQEIGRAGRDGLDAECLLLFSHADVPRLKSLVTSQDEQRNRAAWFHLEDMVRFAEAEDCRKKRLLAYFGETAAQDGCGMCDNCLTPQEQVQDISIAAQKFLSCVKRTGERFGAGHVIDVLRGAETKKIFQFRHHLLSTYGIGKDLSKKQWFYLSRQFQSKGFVQREDNYGGLTLTPEAWRVLKGETKVSGWQDPRHKLSRPEEAATGTESGETPAHHPDLFEQLRQKRKELADQAGVPPYAVFPDKTLMEMATYFPRTDNAFLGTFGVGQTKLEKYGPAFMALIRDFCTAHDISDIPERKPPGFAIVESSPKDKRHFQVGQLYHEGASVTHIANQFHVKPATVINHLYRYFQEGHRIASGHVIDECALSPDVREKVLQAFDRHGYQLLKPVFEAMDREIPYEDLHVLRTYYLYVNEIDGPSETESGTNHDPGVQEKKIVCLAWSRKYSGHCLAGKEMVPDGKWIRPVSQTETGELARHHLPEENRSPIRLMDILSIPVSAHCPHGCQQENYLIGNGSWKKHGTVPVSSLRSLCDPVQTLWINGYSSSNGKNDRIPVDMIKESIHSSLVLILPENLVIHVEEGINLLKQVRISFAFNGIFYKLPVTDPEVESSCLKNPLGNYPLTEPEIYLTISISEPYEGFCYKLVAGLMK
jgi:ATP-dependent DNA helicase RecQ